MTFEDLHKRGMVEGERETYEKLVALRVLRPCARVMSHILSSTITGPRLPLLRASYCYCISTFSGFG